MIPRCLVLESRLTTFSTLRRPSHVFPSLSPGLSKALTYASLVGLLTLVTAGVGAQVVEIGGQMMVSQDTSLCARSVKVDTAPDGRFAVVWSNSDTQTILARRYDSNGSALGDAQVVTASGTGTDPGVGMNKDGEFVVVWAASSSVEAQRFDAAGMAIGNQFTVDNLTGFVREARVAMDDEGAFVVAWEHEVSGAESIRARRYDAAGAALGAAFAVDTTTGLDVVQPSVSMEPDGDSFIVAWQEFPGSGTDIKARRFDSSGVSIGGEFRVNTYTTGFQINPEVAIDAGGAFIVGWHGLLSDSTNVDAVESVFAADGTLAIESRLGDSVSPENNVSVALSNDGRGRFAAFLQSQVGGEDIRVAAYDLKNSRLVANIPGTLDLAVAMDDRERAVVVWRDESGEACGTVQAKRLQMYRTFVPQEELGRVHSTVQQGAWKYYIYFPTQSAELKILLEPPTPATGPRDVDLYAQFGNFPSLTNFDCRPFQGASSPETCIVRSTGFPVLIGVNGWEVGAIDFKLTITEVPALLFDNFETGDTSAWTLTVP